MTEPLARIEAALARLGAEHEPPQGWEARVLAAIAPPRRRWWFAPPRRQRWWFALPVAAAAAIAIFAVFPRDRPFELTTTFKKGNVVMRSGESTPSGESAQLGSSVHAVAAGGDGHRALWVYRNDRLVLECPGAPPCQRSDDAVSADVTFTLRGRYIIVALRSNTPIAPPKGDYDGDVAGAERAGVEVRRGYATVH